MLSEFIQWVRLDISRSSFYELDIHNNGCWKKRLLKNTTSAVKGKGSDRLGENLKKNNWWKKCLCESRCLIVL